ncbi:hypothetical protein D3C72_1406360 [compost metagenome]
MAQRLAQLVAAHQPHEGAGQGGVVVGDDLGCSKLRGIHAGVGIAHQHHGVAEIRRRPAGGIDAVLGLHAGDYQGLHPALLQPAIEAGAVKGVGSVLVEHPIGLADDQLRGKLPERTAGGYGATGRARVAHRQHGDTGGAGRLTQAIDVGQGLGTGMGRLRAVKKADLDVDDEQGGVGQG